MFTSIGRKDYSIIVVNASGRFVGYHAICIRLGGPASPHQLGLKELLQTEPTLRPSFVAVVPSRPEEGATLDHRSIADRAGAVNIWRVVSDRGGCCTILWAAVRFTWSLGSKLGSTEPIRSVILSQLCVGVKGVSLRGLLF